MSSTHLVDEKSFRRRSTSFLREIGTGDVRIDFDTGRDIRLDILKRERDNQQAEAHDSSTTLPTSRPNSAARYSVASSRDGFDWFQDRFLRRGKRTIGVVESLKAIVFSSWLNVFVIFIPLAWVAHFVNHDDPEHPKQTWLFSVTFAASLLAIVPLEKFLEYGGDQMSLYCGKDLGDLIIVTLNNTVEATLAIILLVKCELRLLQSTIIGVILLHLLLVPGIAFIIGGAKLIYQALNPHSAQLNHTLLLMGVLTLLLPTALFTTLQNAVPPESSASDANDPIRDKVLKISHGLAVILLIVYGFSRMFLYNPPGDDNAFRALPDAPAELLEEERKLLDEEPEVNQWVCIVFLLFIIGILAPTAEWLVDSIEIVKTTSDIETEWFGLILLPLSSFAADGMLATGYFARTTIRYFMGWKSNETGLAKARSIEVSIQFNLFWLPLIILIGWWTDRPMTLLFDTFEVAILIGACFLVNFVTADAKTNWAEGATMVSFYFMIALTAWFYTEDAAVAELLSSSGKCSAALAE